jgi:hypothetical protein
MESSSPVSTLRIYGQRSSAPLVFLRACASIQAASLHCLLRVQREAASLHCLLRVQREAAASMVGDAVHRRRPTPRCHTLASRAPQRLPIGSTAARAAFPRRAAVTGGCHRPRLVKRKRGWRHPRASGAPRGKSGAWRAKSLHARVGGMSLRAGGMPLGMARPKVACHMPHGVPLANPKPLLFITLNLNSN